MSPILSLGGLSFALIPSLKTEFLKYTTVFRDREGQMSHMPAGMAAMFLSVLALAVNYAMLGQGASGVPQGARLGATFGL